MKQTKSELDDGQLDQYRLHKSSDQDQFKAIQKAYKQQKPIVHGYGTKLVLQRARYQNVKRS